MIWPEYATRNVVWWLMIVVFAGALTLLALTSPLHGLA